MILVLQAAPLLLLLGLLASGRASPIAACGAALAAAIPAILVSRDGALLPFLAEETLRAAWLAAQPMAVVAGGLLFHAAVDRGDASAPREATAARIFAVSLPMGVFLESVTGFAVGAVFALAALRGMAVAGPVAVALALQSLVMVPWGGLGPGTSLGAALAGIPAHDAAAIAAWPNALWLVLLLPLLWWLQRRAGVAVPPREMLAQTGLTLLMAALLVALHRVLPFEVVGIVAAGLVAVPALWRADPPRDPRAALAAAAPYLLLTAALLASRAVPHPPALRPFADLPAFPLTHVAVVLWVVALGWLTLRPGGVARLRGAMARARRPAATLLLYVVLGRWLAAGGVAAALAAALVAGKGDLAPYGIAPMGFLAGFVTGSGVGANAALMGVQQALGTATGLPPLLAPALHNFAGAAGAGMSVGVTAMICAVLADGTKPVQVWRLLLPSMALVLLCGTLALIVMR
ncbi:MAG: L-lactate permease [Acetobacteraceae bacterium]|nr:L-lactate permease [Acetobacteraceae bacterium]